MLKSEWCLYIIIDPFVIIDFEDSLMLSTTKSQMDYRIVKNSLYLPSLMPCWLNICLVITSSFDGIPAMAYGCELELVSNPFCFLFFIRWNVEQEVILVLPAIQPEWLIAIFWVSITCIWSLLTKIWRYLLKILLLLF